MPKIHDNGLTIDDRYVPENPVTGILYEKTESRRDAALDRRHAGAIAKHPQQRHGLETGKGETVEAMVDPVFGHIMVHRVWCETTVRRPYGLRDEHVEDVSEYTMYRKLTSGAMTRTILDPGKLSLTPVSKESYLDNHYIPTAVAKHIKHTLGTNHGPTTLVPIFKKFGMGHNECRYDNNTAFHNLTPLRKLGLIDDLRRVKTVAELVAKMFGDDAAARPDLVRTVAGARINQILFVSALWDDSMPVDWAVNQLDRLKFISEFLDNDFHKSLCPRGYYPRGYYNIEELIHNVRANKGELDFKNWGTEDTNVIAQNLIYTRNKLRDFEIMVPGFLPELDHKIRARLLKRKTTVMDVVAIDDTARRWRDFSEDNDGLSHNAADPRHRPYAGPLPARGRNWKELEYEINAMGAAHAKRGEEAAALKAQDKALALQADFEAWRDSEVGRAWAEARDIDTSEITLETPDDFERVEAQRIAAEKLAQLARRRDDNSLMMSCVIETLSDNEFNLDAAGRRYTVAVDHDTLRRWAVEMRNCISGYSTDPTSGYVLFGVTDIDGSMLANAQIDTESGGIIQLEIKRNKRENENPDSIERHLRFIWAGAQEKFRKRKAAREAGQSGNAGTAINAAAGEKVAA